MLDAVQHIRDNCGRGRELARALAVEHHVAGRIAVDHDGVKHVLDRREQVFLGNEVRGDIGVSRAVLTAHRAADQLDDAAQLVGVGHVLERDLADALAGDLVRVKLVAKGKVGQNADLAAGVVALDVRGRILFRIAVELCLLERIRKGDAVVDHLGQDVIGGAVQDTADLIELVRSKALEHRADDRDTAADRRFKHIVDALFLRDPQQLLAAGGDQLLVGGAHALAREQAAPGELIRCADAAHDLGHDRDLGVVLDHRKVGNKFMPVGQRGKIPQVEHILDLDRLADHARDLFGVHLEHLVHARTDRAVPHDCCFYHSTQFLHISFPHPAVGRDAAALQNRIIRMQGSRPC